MTLDLVLVLIEGFDEEGRRGCSMGADDGDLFEVPVDLCKGDSLPEE